MHLRSLVSSGLVGSTLLLLTACGGSTPAPEPVLLSQFNKNTDRFGVISTVGKADGTVTKNDRSCDIYKIYTTGLTAGGRAAMKAGEVVTSIATLGLAQMVWAPVNAGTRPQLHTVLFCFGSNDRLVDIFDKDPTDSGAPDHLIIDAAAYSKPVVLQAAAAPPVPLPAAGNVQLPGVTSSPVIPLAQASAERQPGAPSNGGAMATNENHLSPAPHFLDATQPASPRVASAESPEADTAGSDDPGTDALNSASAATAQKENAPAFASRPAPVASAPPASQPVAPSLN